MKILSKLNVKENLRKERILYAIRIITGVIVSIITADRLGIDFAPSTGVITLLTIDETKKDTFRKIALRICSFIYTYAAAWILLDIFKLETTLGFSIAIAFVTLLTFILGWDNTLSVNCVILIQLFLDSKPFNLSLFINESMRLAIGLAAAVIINYIFNVKYDDSDDSTQKETKNKGGN